MSMDSVQQRYENDVNFHTMVDALEAAIEQLQLTPSAETPSTTCSSTSVTWSFLTAWSVLSFGFVIGVLSYQVGPVTIM